MWLFSVSAFFLGGYGRAGLLSVKTAHAEQPVCRGGELTTVRVRRPLVRRGVEVLSRGAKKGAIIKKWVLSGDEGQTGVKASQGGKAVA